MRSLLAAFLMLTGVWAAESFQAKVVGVTDGDTLTVLRDGRGVPVRLHGIDAPERRQAFSSGAKKMLSELTFDKTIRVVVVGKDRYGRTLGELYLADGRCVNQEMVRAGFAWWYRKYAPRDRKLEALEMEAREARRGLWAEEEPTAPWAYRHR